MATMRSDPLQAICLTIGASWIMLAGVAHAQTRTQGVTPSLALKLEHTDNVDGVSDDAALPRQSEDILTINPALRFAIQGATTTVDGQFGLLVEQRLRGTGADRIAPDGRVRWRTALPDKGLGIEAGLRSQQVSSSISSVGSATNSTGNTVTETRADLSPFLERRVNERESVTGRLNGSILRTDPQNDLQRSTQTRSGSAQLAWISRPAPFGYALEANSLSERSRYDTPEQSTGVPRIEEQGETRQTTLRATMLYAWQQDLEMGLIAGTERDHRRVTILSGGVKRTSERDFDGAFGGLLVNWHPTPRTSLAARHESRESGRNWHAELTHRLRRTTFALISEQNTVRNAPTLTSATSLPATATPGPGGVTEGAPVTTLTRNDASSAALSSQRNTSLRVTYTGVRSTLNLTSGRFQARALLDTSGAMTGTDRSRYTAGSIAYRLTPDTTSHAGLRWSRARDAFGVARREWLTTLGLGIRLSQWTNLDCGLSVLRSNATSSATPDGEQTVIHSAQVRLEHRF